MIFDKGMSCNNISFDNISNSHSDIIFGCGDEGSLGYLIGDENISAVAIKYYYEVNHLHLSMESIGRALTGYYYSMGSFAAQLTSCEMKPSKSDNRFALQSLLLQKVFTEGSLAFAAKVSSLLDKGHDDNEAMTNFVFFSSILRCWSAHYCQKVCRLSGFQRGMLKNEITDIEKVHLSFDFLKKMNDNGYTYLQSEIQATVDLARSDRHCDILGGYAADIEAALSRHVETTQHYISQILKNAGTQQGEPVVINSHEFILFTGHLCTAWVWLEQGVAAHDALTNPETAESEKHHYLGKISALDYFCNYELVKTLSQSHMLKRNPEILNFAETDWL